MSREITELKKFKQESTQFYDNKISEIRNLSQKLTKYKPMDQINQITSKLTLSSNTASLIKNAIQKSNQWLVLQLCFIEYYGMKSKQITVYGSARISWCCWNCDLFYAKQDG